MCNCFIFRTGNISKYFNDWQFIFKPHQKLLGTGRCVPFDEFKTRLTHFLSESAKHSVKMGFLLKDSFRIRQVGGQHTRGTPHTLVTEVSSNRRGFWLIIVTWLVLPSSVACQKGGTLSSCTQALISPWIASASIRKNSHRQPGSWCLINILCSQLPQSSWLNQGESLTNGYAPTQSVSAGRGSYSNVTNYLLKASV